MVAPKTKSYGHVTLIFVFVCTMSPLLTMVAFAWIPFK